jgi:hypothetical protein
MWKCYWLCGFEDATQVGFVADWSHFVAKLVKPVNNYGKKTIKPPRNRIWAV